MSDVDRQVAAAKKDISIAQAALAKFEHQHGVARAQAEAAAGDLKEEFGATSVQAARLAIGELEAELEAECTRVREALARAGTGESSD